MKLDKPLRGLFPIHKKYMQGNIGSAFAQTNENNIFPHGSAKAAMNDSGIPRRNSPSNQRFAKPLV
jgi:hypothetical protein